ncbi:MAG: hypothetical protein R3335_00095, partial [Anaerolineales bacterium]|nr:hypothetical protein [Anaerolineales bacterium]
MAVENRRKPRWGLLALISPSLIWLVVFFAVPLVLVLAMSFGERGTYGGVEWNLTLDNFTRFLNLEDQLYLRIFGRTVLIAAITTFVAFLIGYPLAFWIASHPPRRRNTLVLLLMIPFWTNFLVRTYAWILILRDQGAINTVWTGTLNTWFVALEAALPWLPMEGLISA